MTRWKNYLLLSIATCFGLGCAPVAPGTAGALLGVAIYIVIAVLAPASLHTALIALALFIACVVTMALTPWAERHWMKKDPGNFVTDEVVGFLLTVLLFRVPNVMVTILWAFPVTRILDILKVPPCRQLERLPGGWGVLADDLMASVYAALLLHTLTYLFPALFGLAT